MDSNKFVYATFRSNNETLSIEKEDGYKIIKIEGIESSDYEITVEGYTQYDGGYTKKKRVLPRDISILADFNNIKNAEIERSRLIRFFNPKQEGILTVNYCGVERHIAYEVEKFKEKRENLYESLTFQIDLVCVNPFWKSIKEHETTLVTWIPNLEFPAQEGEGIEFFHTEQKPNYWLETQEFNRGVFQEILTEFGQGIGQEWGYRELKQIVEVNNIGDVKCPLRVVFRANGDVEKPYIQDIETYELIRINRTLKSGDILEITTGYGNKNVFLNGKKAHQYLDFLNSSWLQLKSGINLIKYGAEKGLNNLECTVFYTPLYLGV